ncbi:MAG: acyl-CoA thioesterase [Chloroflexi bacterium]|nr:acyl-CoA thioesterase [Chloroflexota bacterium]
MMTAKGKAILEENFTVVVPIQVRFRDLDAMGHVNNAVYLSYLEVARMVYYHQLVGWTKPEDFASVLANVNIDFISPIFLGDEIWVGARIERVGNRSYTFAYEIREGKSGRLIARATSVQVMYDYTTQSTFPVPEDLVAQLEAFEGRALREVE